MATTNEVYQYRVISIGSVLISLYGNLQLLFNWSKLSSEISVTPFLCFLIFIIFYWGLIYVTQILYLQTILNTTNQINDIQIVKISNNLIAFNLINFIWAFLFRYRYYLISEIVVIVEFFIILNHYLNYKIYSIKPVKTYLLINLPTGSLPLSWIFFQLFWNGSLMIHSNGFVARVFANVFIWDYLVIGACFLFLFNDYTIGFSLSYLILGMALNQLFVKVIALQWIFAFIISGLLFAMSLWVIVSGPKLKNETVIQEESVENTPLIT